MPPHVLVPVDGSAESRAAVAYAIEQYPEARLVLLHVIEPFPDHTKAGGHAGGRAAQVFERGQRLVNEMAERGEEYAGTISTELVYGRPVHAIPRYVETHGVDEVVVGSRGRDGTTRLLFGSVAETVVRRVPVPVTVVRSTGDPEEARHRRPEHVLVPFDRSFCSRNALEYAFEQFPDASVTALFVEYPLTETYERLESGDDLAEAVTGDESPPRETRAVLEAARQIADRNGRAVDTATEAGDPARRVLAWIDEHTVDHVVIGCHGRDGVARWLLGSVAETVIRRAPVPVTAVK